MRINRPQTVAIAPALCLFGKTYRVDWIVSRKAKTICLLDDHINVLFPADGTQKEWDTLLTKFYKAKLQDALPALLEKWAAKMKVLPSGFGIKRMRTRWGTCNTRTHFIWFSLMLSQKSIRLVEYIVVHELCHLLERSHNARFKFLMTNFLRDWHDRDRELDGK